MKNMEQRYSEAINKIGGTFGLLALPEEVKKVLMKEINRRNDEAIKAWKDRAASPNNPLEHP